MDSIWNTENFVSLVETQERESGEWLGADVIIWDGELDEPYFQDSDEDFDWAVQDRYDNSVYGR